MNKFSTYRYFVLKPEHEALTFSEILKSPLYVTAQEAEFEAERDKNACGVVRFAFEAILKKKEKDK